MFTNSLIKCNFGVCPRKSEDKRMQINLTFVAAKARDGYSARKGVLLHRLAATRMAKPLALMLLALVAISMLQETAVLASQGDHHQNRNARHNARGGAAGPSTTSHACSSVKSAAESACACPQAIMGTKPCALATTTGRPRKEDPSALRSPPPPILALYAILGCPFLISSKKRLNSYML
ncbi:hypothetical protein ACH5RR_011183 [Cinchona calisaya]|uniref:Uncharacterized protein n=1 Tax=Cinchona calisaya TaxID=153742 RepID=A0ABD3A465_9GENT